MPKIKLLLSYLLFRNYHIESHINESSIQNRLIYGYSKGLEDVKNKMFVGTQADASPLGNAWERKQTQALSGTQAYTLKELHV